RAGASVVGGSCAQSSAGRAVADRAPSKERESSGGSVARGEASWPTARGSPGSTSRPHPTRSAELTCVLLVFPAVTPGAALRTLPGRAAARLCALENQLRLSSAHDRTRGSGARPWCPVRAHLRRGAAPAAGSAP